MVNARRMLVVIESDDPQIARRAQELASGLGLDAVRHAEIKEHRGDDDASAWRLALGDAGLELRAADDRPGRGLCVDFSTLNPHAARRRGGFSRNQPLGKAIGRQTHTVLDATAGLGHDAALLACMGYRVIAAERSPVMFALLEDGLRRAHDNEELREALGGRLTIVNADAREIIASRTTSSPDQFDAVYIDPMFPPKRKASALAKKEIRMVRAIVGEDEDAADLASFAIQHARRVVIKRPTYAGALIHNPTMRIASKLVRYDVYIQPGQ